MRLSPRIQATAEPAIPAARAWAARYAGQAGPAVGEPAYDVVVAIEISPDYAVVEA